MKRTLATKKKLIALVMTLFILLSSFPALSVDAAGTKHLLMYQDPFNANGSVIKATNNVTGTDIVKGFTMAQSYISSASGSYISRCYCLNMGNHPYSQTMEDANSNEGVWAKMAQPKREAIQNIIALGLEGNNKGSSSSSKNFSNVSSYPIQNKARTTHYIYSNTNYGSGDYTDSEIYIATQLLIWEITQGYRKPGSLQKTSKSLVTAYSNSHIKAVYNYIADRLYTINVIPSFTVKKSADTNINTYNFKITYDAVSKTYSASPTSKKLVSTNKNVLKHYTDLAQNKAIAVKNPTTGATVYVKIDANISGDSLTLTYKGVSSSVPSGYTTGTQSKSVEKNLPSSGQSGSANFVAYNPTGEGMENAQAQLGVKATCRIDPVYAYFNIGASIQAEGVNRDFNIQKDMRIKSETTPSGEKSDNSSLDATEKGYYFYVRLPKGGSTYNTVENGKVVTKNGASENAQSVLGLTTSNMCYNKALDEYYVIMGPTNSDGITGDISTYMSRYVKSGINESNVPYGNYYVFELGQADTSKGFTKTTALNGSQYSLDINPNHYSMPDGVTSYHFTYEEHLNGNKRDGVVGGSVDYYNRLKRIYRASTSITSATPSFVNLTSVKVRIKKVSSDNLIKGIVFKIEKKSSNNWVDCNLNDYIADKGYSSVYNYILTANGEIATYDINKTLSDGYVREKGYTPYLYLPAGDYRITELGRIKTASSVPVPYKELEFRKYLIKPDPIEFNIGNDDSILEEYVNNGEIEYEVNNYANVHMRLFKKDNTDKPLNGAIYELYNENKNLMTTLETQTLTIDGVTYEGVAEIDGLTFSKYYVKEIKAPDGYIIDNQMYEINFRSTNLDFENGNVTDYKSVTLVDKPTNIKIIKTDEDGNLIKGAKLELYDTSDNDKVLYEITTDEKPYELTGKLIVGHEYRLHEAQAPSELYQLADDITFTVKDTSETQSITMVDKLQLGSVTVTKVDENSNALSGAVFELYTSDDKLCKVSKIQNEYKFDENGNDTLISDDNGRFKVVDLPLGDYYIIETKAPDGKLPYADKITFSIDSTTEKSLNPDLVVSDESIVLLETGGNGRYAWYVGGIILLLMFAIGLFINKRSNKK